MRAMICRQWGGPEDLRLETVESPALKAVRGLGLWVDRSGVHLGHSGAMRPVEIDDCRRQ